VIAYLALFVALCTGSAWAAASIGPNDIQKNAVKSRHIKNGQVKKKDLHGASVNTDKIQDGAVGTLDLGTDSVTSPKIADGGVNSGDLANGAVDAPSLGNVVARVKEITLPANGNVADNVFCQPGERLIGGGARSILFDGWLVSSRPIKSDGADPADGQDDLTGWRAAVHNDSATASTFKIFAMCLQ